MLRTINVSSSETKFNAKGEATGERKFTGDELKEAITENVGDQTVLILPDAQRLPASLRYWLEGLLDDGVRLIAFAVANPQRDVFLRLLEIELALPTDGDIRSVMASEAKRLGLKLSRSQLATLQAQAGRNPMLAKKVIRAEALGINNNKPEHSQYIDISPIIIASLMGFGIIRFIGLGTGNRGLYIIGGICFILAMMFRQIGQVRGARKRVGQ